MLCRRASLGLLDYMKVRAPPDTSPDTSSEEEEEDKLGPGILGEESTEAPRAVDHEAQWSSLSWDDWMGSRLNELRELQLQQVSLDDPGREHKQLPAVGKDKGVKSTPPDPRTRRAERRQVQCQSARLFVRRQYQHSLFNPAQRNGRCLNMSSFLGHVPVSCILTCDHVFGPWTGLQTTFALLVPNLGTEPTCPLVCN